MKILLFKVGALGDVLLTTPLARQVRRRFPGARIDYLTGRSFAGVLGGNPNLDAVHGFSEEIFFRRRPLGLASLAARIRPAAYDLAFVLDRHWIFPLSALLFGIPRRVGFERSGREGWLLTDRVPYGEVRHEVHCYLDLLAAVAEVDREDRALEYHPPAEEAAAADRFLAEAGLENGRVVCLAPGGGDNPGQRMALKRWPPGRYALLARRLREDGFGVVLVGGPTDLPLADAIRSEADVPSAVGAPLGVSASLFRRAQAVVCSDGGPMHLAAAVTDRVISLFGPTDPRRLAPLDGYAVLWKPGACGPCYDIYGRYRECRRDGACMADIAPDEVREAVHAVARERGPRVQDHP